MAFNQDSTLLVFGHETDGTVGMFGRHLETNTLALLTDCRGQNQVTGPGRAVSSTWTRCRFLTLPLFAVKCLFMSMYTLAVKIPIMR
jgi:hypothetical protein